MRKTLIFPCSWLAGVLLCMGSALAQPAAETVDPDADLKVQKPSHEQQLHQIERERKAFSRELAKREEECLTRFFSASCMETIRTDHLREMRSFDLRREAELQALRTIDAEMRNRARKRRERS